MSPAVQIAGYETDLRIYKKNKNKYSSISYFGKKKLRLALKRATPSDRESDDDDDD